MMLFLARFLREPGLVIKRLFQCTFLWGKPSLKGNLKQAQVILTQAASDLDGGIPSRSNMNIADCAQKYGKLLGIPIFPQREVGEILKSRGIPIIGETPFQSEVPLFSNEYLGADGIAKMQKKVCDSMGWTKVLVVSDYPLIWRASWIYERLGLKVIIPPDLPKRLAERTFSQKRHRYHITARPFEFLARLFFLYKGSI